MLQIDLLPFASDALEDAMRLAQIKALNSFTFSDCLNYLNYAWSDVYNRIACIDSGFYSKTVKLTKKLTKLPAAVKNTISVYMAYNPLDYNRVLLRQSNNSDLQASGTYHISGMDLLCPDAERSKNIWLNYVPACPQIFFTYNNRDPKLLADTPCKRESLYNLYKLVGTIDDTTIDVSDDTVTSDTISKCTNWYLQHRSTKESQEITEYIIKEGDEDNGYWKLVYISCDFPYIFVSYKHSITNTYMSGFYDSDFCFNEYNPFDFTGRKSNIEYLQTKYNDKTGLGVIIIDHNDMDQIKELGWTPDSKLQYPTPEVYRYLVAKLADKFSALNESNVSGVQKELIEAQYAFEAFLAKDKASWKRIQNVNISNMGDFL